VAHAGWRGAGAGLLTRLRTEMAQAGHTPTHAAVGPGIGPCCFEVGEEVATKFYDFRAVTSWGTNSVDLVASLTAELSGLEIWGANSCTLHQPGWFSYRRDQTSERLATVGWLP
jgi:copper oxidase (laccase) domain-containing protein